MEDFREAVQKMIEVAEKEQGSISVMSAICYLKGVRDALGGASLAHVIKNVKKMVQSRHGEG